MRNRGSIIATVSVATALALAGCSGDAELDADVSAETDVEADAETGGADAEEDDSGTAAEEAQETLDEAGIDINAPGTAEVQFMGETYTLDAAAQFGCFIAPDAGSDGTVNFDGSDEEGNELYVEWSGDSGGRVDFRTADGTGYTTVFETELDVAIDGSSAEVGSTMTPETSADGQEQLTASLACGG